LCSFYQINGASASRRASELDLEVRVSTRKWNPLDLKIAHVGAGRAPAKPGGEPGKPLRLSFSNDFDAAIRKVGDGAVDAEPARFVDCRVSETDSLHAADHERPEGLLRAVGAPLPAIGGLARSFWVPAQAPLPAMVARIIVSSSA